MSQTDKIDTLIKNLKTPASGELDQRIAHLIEQHCKEGKAFEPAVRAALQEVRGAYGVAVICADEPDNDFTREQLDTFRECTIGCELPLSIANSAGILAWPESHADWNRPGIMLFGTSPFASDIEATRDLQPAMTFASEIIAIREVATGESVGYGRRWTAERPSVIATIAAGYADGYPRHAQNGTPVLVCDQVAPLVGAVSMDMITVDLTDHPGASIGDPVELWGRSVLVNDVAAHAGAIGYQLLTGVTPRVPRIYHQ